MDLFTNEEMQSINSALDKFEVKLKLIVKDSPDAYALVIFVNACLDTGKFQSNRYSALVHFPKARQAANELEHLLQHEESRLFNKAIAHAHGVIINHRLVHVDLCFG